MNFEFFIVKRIIQSKNNSGNFSTSILKISVAAVAIGIAVMLIAIATGTGLQKKIRDKVIGFDGHIQITNILTNNSLESTSLSIDSNLIKKLNDLDFISNSQVFATKAGILKTKENFEAVLFKGVNETYNWTFFNQYLLNSSSLALKNKFKNDSLILSRSIANKLNVSQGDRVYFYFIREKGHPRTIPFYIKGTYHTGLEDFDNIYVLGDIQHIQDLNNWRDNEVGGIEINLNDISMLNEAKEEINDLIPYDQVVKDSKSKNELIFNWLALFDINIFVILLIMIVVAVINMISSILILILERTKMIGVLKSIGASNWQIRKIFIYNGAYLVMKGLLWGNMIGLSLCFIQHYTGFLKLDEASYYVSKIPVYLNLYQIIGINLTTFFICMFMMLLPSIIITKITPIKSIRFQ